MKRSWLNSFAKCLLLTTVIIGVSCTNNPLHRSPSDARPANTSVVNEPGPKVTLFTLQVPASKVVYIIDNNGSLLDDFDFIKLELKRSVQSLQSGQSFAVIFFNEFESAANILGPSHLQPATKEVCGKVATRIDKIRVEGGDDDSPNAVKDAFRNAFAMQPDTIIFLTNSETNGLLDLVRQLDTAHVVHIHTVCMSPIADYQKEIQELARTHHGIYKFLNETDLNVH